MDYYESAEGMTISKERAMFELVKHNASWEDFVADNGEHEEYDAQDVLAWLGVLSYVGFYGRECFAGCCLVNSQTDSSESKA